MQTEEWDHKYLELAKYVSQWSHDPSTKVGAVLVNYESNLEFIGYNGFPRGVEDYPERYLDRTTKYAMIVHAEVNAILKAGHHARGASLYVYPSFAAPNVCCDCAKIAIQAGVAEVVGYVAPPSEREERWKDSIALSATMFIEAGVFWRTVA